MANMEETAYDVVEESIGSLEDKKRYNKEMNSRLKDAAKESGIAASTLKRVKDYVYYKGKAWVDNDPFNLGKEKLKDKLSPLFIKLHQAIDDVYAVGQVEILTEYLRKLESFGIKIDLDGFVPSQITSNSAACDDAIADAVGYQKSIHALADRINDEDAPKAESLGFGPKKEYNKLISLLADKRDGKDVDDKIQEIQTNLLFAQQSYTDVMNDTINADPLKNPPEENADYEDE